MKNFKGIYPALVTPYTASGSVAFDVIERLIDKLIGDEVSGFYLTGSTGECFFLSEQERRKVVEAACSRINGRANTIVHVGAISTQHTVELAKHAESCGADAISAIPPFYYKYSFEEILEQYNTVMDSTSLPMFIYNFPAITGIQFTVAQFAELASHKNFAGIKHTSQDLFQMQQIKAACPNKLIFNGHDEVFLAGLSMGADGAIGSTFNIMAPRFKRILRYFESGEIAKAQQEQITANEIISALIYAGVNQGIKYLLQFEGIECNGCRKPMKKITNEAMIRLDNIRNLI